MTKSSDHNDSFFIKVTQTFLIVHNCSIQHIKLKQLMSYTFDPDICSCYDTVPIILATFKSHQEMSEVRSNHLLSFA